MAGMPPDEFVVLLLESYFPMKTVAVGFVIFPTSWRLGVWSRPKKDILSIGPFRFVFYKAPGMWKPKHGDVGV